MPAYSTHRLRALRLPERREEDDVVAAEGEPLEIRVSQGPVAVTMRTPRPRGGARALGFLPSTEGLEPVSASRP